jgi:hypothetical protein
MKGVSFVVALMAFSHSALADEAGVGGKLTKVATTGWVPALTFEQMVHGLVQFEIDALDRATVGARTGA